MTPEFLVLVFGVALSLAVSYIPGLSAAYDKLDGSLKRVVMLAGVIVIGAGVYGLNCAGVPWAGVPSVACTQQGALGVMQAVIMAAIANQATYALSPKS